MPRLPILLASLALTAFPAFAGPPVPVFSGRPSLPPVPTAEAVALFQEVCVDTAPRFRNAPERVTAHGLTLGEDGLYQALNLDLIVALFDDEGRRACAIIFRPAENVNPTGYALYEAGKGRAVDVFPMSSRGEVYMVAKIPAP